MNLKTKDERQAVRYLLGELNEAEQAQLEERSFSDGQFSDLLSDAENDLIDEYVRGELSARERERFERNFLISDRRRGKVEIARSLLETGSATARPRAASEAPASPGSRKSWLALFGALRPATSYALAAAALIFLASGLWLFTEIRHLREEVTRLEAERAAGERHNEQLQRQADEQRQIKDELSAENDELQHELASLRQQAEAQSAGQRSAPSILTFILSPGYRSSEGPEDLTVPRAITVVRAQLRLNPGDDYIRYDVRLQTASGDHIRSWRGLRVRSVSGVPAVFIDIPARLLNRGQYELTLKGVAGSGQTDILGYYYFNKN